MIDYDRFQDDVQRLLCELIRFDTSNPPGNETVAAEFIAGELEAAGYEPVLMESAPGRGNVVARLEGSGEGRPLLLFGHLDVVPTEPEHWSHPPFEGKIHDGFLWGRGALDMKHIVASQLAIMLALKRAGVALKRDVIYAATADEEAGGRMGIIWLRDHHPELIQAQYGLTEFGGFSLDVGGQRFYMCQTGEKGFVWLEMHAEGRPGHGSMPHGDSAVLKISEAVTKLGRHSPPLHVCETSRAMVEGMAVVEPALMALLDPDKVDFVLSKLPPEQALLFNAILRNTVTVTGLEAGYKHNVIPGEATAKLDCRIVPGQTEQDVLAEVEAVVGDGFEFEIVEHSPATESPLDTELYASMVKHLQDYDPDGIVVPMLLVGGTDGRHLAPGGLVYYGYSPIRLPSDLKFMQLVHGHDERIPVEAYREGAAVFARTVLDFCSA